MLVQKNKIITEAKRKAMIAMKASMRNAIAVTYRCKSCNVEIYQLVYFDFVHGSVQDILEGLKVQYHSCYNSHTQTGILEPIHGYVLSNTDINDAVYEVFGTSNEYA